jgi:hypothetical protein
MHQPRFLTTKVTKDIKDKEFSYVSAVLSGNSMYLKNVSWTRVNMLFLCDLRAIHLVSPNGDSPCTPGQKVRNGTFREAPLENPLPQGTLSCYAIHLVSPDGDSPCTPGHPLSPDGNSPCGRIVGSNLFDRLRCNSICHPDTVPMRSVFDPPDQGKSQQEDFVATPSAQA